MLYGIFKVLLYELKSGIHAILIPYDCYIVHDGDAAVCGNDVFYSGQFFFLFRRSPGGQVIEERNHRVVDFLINAVSEIYSDSTIA